MNEPIKKTNRFELAVMIAGFMLLAALFVFGSRSSEASVDETKPAVSEAQDFSRFQHSNPMHARMPCLLCHKRDDNSAAPKLSGHTPCSGCHVQQFADSANQICTICHTNAATGAVKRFPRLQSFSVRFDHSRHVRQTNSATCHKPSRQGRGSVGPVGRRSTHDVLPVPWPANRGRRPEYRLMRNVPCAGPSSAEFRRFGGLCQELRPWRTSAVREPELQQLSHCKARKHRGRQVSSPAVSMHFAAAGTLSCGACHNNKRAFGGNDFTDCKRCHQNGSFRF